jgi:hypothetical protein
MSSFKDPNAFADPEDSELVRKNKRLIPESIHYNYTEVIDRSPVLLPSFGTQPELSYSAM